MRQALDNAICFVEKNIPCDRCNQPITFNTDEVWWLEHVKDSEHVATVDAERMLVLAKSAWERDNMEMMHKYMWAYVVLDAGAMNPEKAMESYRTALEYIV